MLKALKITAIILGFTFLTACSDDKDSPSANIDPAAKAEYLKGCMQSSGMSKAICECMLDVTLQYADLTEDEIDPNEANMKIMECIKKG